MLFTVVARITKKKTIYKKKVNPVMGNRSPIEAYLRRRVSKNIHTTYFMANFVLRLGKTTGRHK